MVTSNKVNDVLAALVATLLSLTLASCVSGSPRASAESPPPPSDSSPMKMQSLVMDMADDYIASLGESVYLLTRSGKLDVRGRWLAQSFLRNGVGAGLDIAVGPNPAVNLLDILVLTSLQRWSFEAHWMPAGIGDAGLPALERLKKAEAETWTLAKANLSAEQLSLVRGLIDAWIAENRDRTVVALVRFKEFADERRISSLMLRGKASGLLKEVGEATAVVDDARLLGERLLWLAGRYPYLLGEQTELTAYRLMDQPEGVQLVEAIASARKLSDALTERIGSIQQDLETTVNTSLDRATEEIATLAGDTINQVFDRFARERTQLLDDIGSRRNELIGMMKELNETIAVSGALARELTETVNAIDRVVSRFDVDPEDKGEPLRMTDVRDAAIETGRAADRVTRLLEQTVTLLESKEWEQRLASVVGPANTLFDKAFWRGVVLICLLIAGFGLLRLVPQRVKESGPDRRS